MPNKKVSVAFHSIDEAGFYPFAKKAPTFGGLNETLQQLELWGKGKRLSLTRLMDRRDEDAEMPVYLLGIEKCGNDWIFATWNQVPDYEGDVVSVSMDSVVGEPPDVHMNSIEDETIPGFATYFWVVPQRSVIASVRIDTRATAKAPMRSYIERFLETESGYVVENDKQEIVGYRPIGSADKPKKLRPRFRISTYTKRGALEYIRQHREQIARVVRSGHLQAANAQDQTALQGMLAFLRGARRNRRVARERKVSLTLEFTPTAQELEAMINEEMAAQNVSHWDDLGFQMEGQLTDTYWVGRSFAKDVQILDIPDAVGGVYDLVMLGAQLGRRRDDLLRLLDDD